MSIKTKVMLISVAHSLLIIGCILFSIWQKNPLALALIWLKKFFAMR